MKKIVIVSILVLALICSLSTVVRATDQIDINDPAFSTVPDKTPEPTPTPAEDANTTKNENKDNSVAKTENPQTGIKEEAPIIIITLIGICVAVYAGRKIKKYNY